MADTNKEIKKTRMMVFQDTAENLSGANPLLLTGEWGLETDTSRMKIGDGVNKWKTLPYKIDLPLTQELLDIIMLAKKHIEQEIERYQIAD